MQEHRLVAVVVWLFMVDHVILSIPWGDLSNHPRGPFAAGV